MYQITKISYCITFAAVVVSSILVLSQSPLFSILPTWFSAMLLAVSIATCILTLLELVLPKKLQLTLWTGIAALSGLFLVLGNFLLGYLTYPLQLLFLCLFLSNLSVLITSYHAKPKPRFGNICCFALLLLCQLCPSYIAIKIALLSAPNPVVVIMTVALLLIATGHIITQHFETWFRRHINLSAKNQDCNQHATTVQKPVAVGIKENNAAPNPFSLKSRARRNTLTGTPAKNIKKTRHRRHTVSTLNPERHWALMCQLRQPQDTSSINLKFGNAPCASNCMLQQPNITSTKQSMPTDENTGGTLQRSIKYSITEAVNITAAEVLIKYLKKNETRDGGWFQTLALEENKSMIKSERDKLIQKLLPNLADQQDAQYQFGELIKKIKKIDKLVARFINGGVVALSVQSLTQDGEGIEEEKNMFFGSLELYLNSIPKAKKRKRMELEQQISDLKQQWDEYQQPEGVSDFGDLSDYCSDHSESSRSIQ